MAMAMDLGKINLGNISTSTKHLVAALVALALSGLFYFYMVKPRSAELDQLQAENARLRKEVQEGTAVETRYNEFQQELAEMEGRLKMLNAILPTEKEASNFLRSVQKMATDSNLKINLFKPRDTLEPQDFYSKWPVEISLEGNYHGLGRFFEKISRTPRIIDVPTLKITHIEDQTNASRTLIATGTATTYVQMADQVQTGSMENMENKEGSR